MLQRSPLVRFAVAAAAALAPTATARAQSSGRNPAEAQALYDQARQLVAAGDYANACPKFKESYRIDPGGGTLLNLADCYEKQGKTALAWSTFKEALVVAQRDGRQDRVDFASSHLGTLEGRLARLTVHVTPQARVTGLSVTVDGATLGDAAWDVAVPIDPGEHVVRAEAPGKAPFSATVRVPPTAAAERIDVPALSDAAAAPEPPRRLIAPAATNEAGGSSRGTVGWIIGGVGLAAIGAGSYFGLRAFSRWSDRNSACTGGCTPAAKAAGDDASQAATISTIGFAAGLVAVGVGAYLVLSASAEGHGRSAGEPRLIVAAGPMGDRAGFWVRGGW
jgi:hypothetical protein